jgi:hypothetical protein
MLWQRYVFRRGAGVHEMWDSLFDNRSIRLLYIVGRGFDTRAQTVMAEFVRNLRMAEPLVEKADLLLLGFHGYQLSDELREQTALNAGALEALFKPLGQTATISIGSSAAGEDDITASNALRIGTENALRYVADYTDVILDISSMPRIAYLALITALLSKLVPDKTSKAALWASGVNFQVLVAEDPALDGQIRSEDPSNDLVLIPGFSSALHAESVQEWPFVWFPILGENRVAQLEKVLASAIPDLAEICPVLPHPSKDPRRGERLLVEYRRPLFDSRQTPTSNILYAHESNPFEAYRQLLGAMERYRESLSILGGCRLVVTPLGSKLITVGAGLACFEMRPRDLGQNYALAIPYAGPTRYVAESEAFRAARPEVAALVLTGAAYQ